MQRTYRSRIALVITARMLVVVAALALGSLVIAQGGGDTRSPTRGGGQVQAPGLTAPVPGGPGFYAQSALLCKPYNNTGLTYQGQILGNESGGDLLAMCPLSLPNGVTVTKFVVYFQDYAYDMELQASLIRCPLENDSCLFMAQVTSLDYPATSAETTYISDPVIDQQSSSYAVEVLLPSHEALGLKGIRVDYAYSGHLPVITKNKALP